MCIEKGQPFQGSGFDADILIYATNLSRLLEKQALTTSYQEFLDRIGNVAGASVIDRAGRPSESIDVWRPYSKNGLFTGQVESKHGRKARVLRTYHVNKKLADDLCARVTIVVGGAPMSTPGYYAFRKNEKR